MYDGWEEDGTYHVEGFVVYEKPALCVVSGWVGGWVSYLAFFEWVGGWVSYQLSFLSRRSQFFWVGRDV